VGRRGRVRIDSELAYGFIADGVSRPVFLGENKFREKPAGQGHALYLEQQPKLFCRKDPLTSNSDRPLDFRRKFVEGKLHSFNPHDIVLCRPFLKRF